MRCYRDLHIRDRKCITPRSLLAIPVFHCISKPRPPIFFFLSFLECAFSTLSEQRAFF